MMFHICENTTTQILGLDRIWGWTCRWGQHRILASECSGTLTSPTYWWCVPPSWSDCIQQKRCVRFWFFCFFFVEYVATVDDDDVCAFKKIFSFSVIFSRSFWMCAAVLKKVAAAICIVDIRRRVIIYTGKYIDLYTWTHMKHFYKFAYVKKAFFCVSEISRLIIFVRERTTLDKFAHTRWPSFRFYFLFN